MGLYRISAGDNRTFQHKQNFESSKFDLNGLNCIIVNENDHVSIKFFIEKDYQNFDSLCKQRTGHPFADLANKFPQKLGLRDTDAEVKAAKKQLCRNAPNSVVHPCKRVYCWQLTPLISASVKWTRLENPNALSHRNLLVPKRKDFL